LEQHKLFEATSYAVQSPVPRDAFEMFVNSLMIQPVISVTHEKWLPLSLLTNEFSLPGLEAERARLPLSIDQFSSLCDRIFALELQLSSFSPPPRRIEEEIDSQEEATENLHLALEKLQTSLQVDCNPNLECLQVHNGKCQFRSGTRFCSERIVV
jgi:hypothetical protein